MRDSDEHAEHSRGREGPDRVEICRRPGVKRRPITGRCAPHLAPVPSAHGPGEVRDERPSVYPPAGAGSPDSEFRRERIYIVVVDAEGALASLVRVLGQLAVQDAILVSVAATASDDGVSIELIVRGVADNRAEHLASRLRQMPAVRTVTV